MFSKHMFDQAISLLFVLSPLQTAFSDFPTYWNSILVLFLKISVPFSAPGPFIHGSAVHSNLMFNVLRKDEESKLPNFNKIVDLDFEVQRLHGTPNS